MAKNIILLSDGTGNSAGKLQKTNVWRVYQALDLLPPDSPDRPDQIAYYDDGVGSSSFRALAILGGATGWGLKRNVIDLYTFLCRNYRDEDQIYLFGFSRGAFTIRVLAGLVVNQGLVSADTEAELKRKALDAFREYRRQKYKTILRLEVVGRAIRNAVGSLKPRRATRTVPNRRPGIRFVGVWDTVAAYGLPIDELTRAWNAVFPLSVPDRNLSDKVVRACHAVAIDDERNTFHPVLWNEDGRPDEKHIKQERLTQVWFSGMHSNVGGGYADDALANVSLHWMMTEAQREGLAFKDGELDKVRIASHVDGKMYHSRQGLGGGYRYLPRKMQMLSEDTDYRDNQVIIKRPKIHESVFRRIATGAEGYAPIVLPPFYAVVNSDGDILDMSPAEQQREQERAGRQEKVWNLVWGRRIVYFTAVFVALLLAFFPLLWPAASACAGALCGIALLVRGMGAVLPDFLQPWFAAYETHAVEFIVLLTALIVLLSVGGRMRTAIFDRMRKIWRNSPDAPAGERDWLTKLRLSDLYVRLWKLTKRRVLPTIAGVAALVLIVAGLSRALFTVVDAAGGMCAPTAANTPAQAVFSTSAICWPTGVQLTQGTRYRLTITMDEPWRDNDIATGVDGFRREGMSPIMYLGQLLRRHLGEPWFRPVARIGHTGTDEYPLDRSSVWVANQDRQQLTAEIQARRDGELFLFVNDAVTPVPAWQPFYRNNKGTATVTVVPAPAGQ